MKLVTVAYGEEKADVDAPKTGNVQGACRSGSAEAALGPHP